MSGIRFDLWKVDIMAFIGIHVPLETAKLLSRIEVPGEKSSTDSLHVTLLYLGKEQPIEAILLAIQATYNVIANWSPFMLSTKWVSTFPENPDDGVPIIARVESPDLHELQQALKEAFDDEGVPFNNKFPDFKPHVTLSYAKESIEDFVLKRPVVWQATGISLWGGDNGEDVISVSFPFDAPAAEPTRDFRAFIKAAMIAGDKKDPKDEPKPYKSMDDHDFDD